MRAQLAASCTVTLAWCGVSDQVSVPDAPGPVAAKHSVVGAPPVPPPPVCVPPVPPVPPAPLELDPLPLELDPLPLPPLPPLLVVPGVGSVALQPSKAAASEAKQRLSVGRRAFMTRYDAPSEAACQEPASLPLDVGAITSRASARNGRPDASSLVVISLATLDYQASPALDNAVAKEGVIDKYTAPR